MVLLTPSLRIYQKQRQPFLSPVFTRPRISDAATGLKEWEEGGSREVLNVL